MAIGDRDYHARDEGSGVRNERALIALSGVVDPIWMQFWGWVAVVLDVVGSQGVRGGPFVAVDCVPDVLGYLLLSASASKLAGAAEREAAGAAGGPAGGWESRARVFRTARMMFVLGGVFSLLQFLPEARRNVWLAADAVELAAAWASIRMWFALRDWADEAGLAAAAWWGRVGFLDVIGACVMVLGILLHLGGGKLEPGPPAACLGVVWVVATLASHLAAASTTSSQVRAAMAARIPP